jgi:outer membrane lipoprotein-sorting protein
LTESQLWVDDETGFPLKNELTQINGGVRQSNSFITEIRDLVIGPPPANWFEVPANFRELPITEFWTIDTNKP